MVAIENIAATFPSHAADLDMIRDIKAPAPTDSWHPISHRQAFDLTVDALDRHGMEITGAEFGLAGKTGIERFFGALDVRAREDGHRNPDFSMSIGIGNSIDKSFPYRLVGGERVFVCSNLMFSGDFSVKRKHTSQIMEQLPELIDANIGSYLSRFVDREAEIARWKETEIGDQEAAYTIMEAIRNRAVISKQAERVYNEWREPRHPEFKDRTVWSLQNAFTEIQKTRAAEPNDMSNNMLRLMGTFRERFPEPVLN